MTAVPMTAVAVGTTSMLRLELQACCYCDSRVRLSELHPRVAVPDAGPDVSRLIHGHALRARTGIGRECGAGPQIACTRPDRTRKTVAACDERGDETNRFSGTKRRADNVSNVGIPSSSCLTSSARRRGERQVEDHVRTSSPTRRVGMVRSDEVARGPIIGT